MKHNRMINPLDNSNEEELDDLEPFISRDRSEQATEIAHDLILSFAKSMEGKQLSPFELMQSLVEFFVGTVKALENTEKVPDNFRKILMRNIELNFDYKDAKDHGIDLSDLLLMGLQEDLEDGEENL